MTTTRYFEAQVLRRRPEIVQPRGEATVRVLGVVTLSDGETVHNAFFDRGFKKGDR